MAKHPFMFALPSTFPAKVKFSTLICPLIIPFSPRIRSPLTSIVPLTFPSILIDVCETISPVISTPGEIKLSMLAVLAVLLVFF